MKLLVLQMTGSQCMHAVLPCGIQDGYFDAATTSVDITDL